MEEMAGTSTKPLLNQGIAYLPEVATEFIQGQEM